MMKITDTSSKYANEPKNQTMLHIRKDFIINHYYYLLLSTYALHPSRLIVQSGLDVPTFATRCLHASPCKSTQWQKVEPWARDMSGNFA